MAMGRNSRTRSTFKPKKTVIEGSKASQLKRYATAVLGSGNLKQAVILPEGEDLNEWLAVNSTLSSPLLSSFRYVISELVSRRLL